MRGIVFGCFAESVPNKKFFQGFVNQKRAKESQKGAKGIQKGAKGSQKGAKGSQKGAKMEPMGDQNAYKNPPTLWSGVLDHVETKGGGFLPPTPHRPGRLARAHSKPRPV